MPRLLRSALVALACVLGAAVAPAAASAQTPAGSESGSSGPVTATLSWQGGEDITGNSPRLQIARDGTTVLDADLASQCQLCGGVDPTDALHLVDLDGDGEPEVLVDMFSGGAHCCSTVLIWYLDGSTYSRKVLSLGDMGYRVRDLDGDGRPEITTRDDSFAYAFSAFAFSWFPPLVFDWRGHALVDVTRRFPRLMRSDEAAIRRALPGLRRHYDPRGAVAAYVADEYLRGRPRQARRYLDDALRRGDLRAVPPGDSTWPSGRAYRTALLRFLARNGYR